MPHEICAPPQAPGEGPSCFFQLRAALACGHVTPVSAPSPQGFSCVFLFLQGYQSADVGPTLNPKSSHLKIFTLITPAKTLLPNKSHVPRCQVDMNLGDTIQSTAVGLQFFPADPLS